MGEAAPRSPDEPHQAGPDGWAREVQRLVNGRAGALCGLVEALTFGKPGPERTVFLAPIVGEDADFRPAAPGRVVDAGGERGDGANGAHGAHGPDRKRLWRTKRGRPGSAPWRGDRLDGDADSEDERDGGDEESAVPKRALPSRVERQIHDLCGSVGLVAQILVKREREFAVVKFYCALHARRAVQQLKGMTFRGKRLRIWMSGPESHSMYANIGEAGAAGAGETTASGGADDSASLGQSHAARFGPPALEATNPGEPQPLTVSKSMTLINYFIGPDRWSDAIVRHCPYQIPGDEPAVVVGVIVRLTFPQHAVMVHGLGFARFANEHGRIKLRGAEPAPDDLTAIRAQSPLRTMRTMGDAIKTALTAARAEAFAQLVLVVHHGTGRARLFTRSKLKDALWGNRSLADLFSGATAKKLTQE